jgi:hypothetical protein
MVGAVRVVPVARTSVPQAVEPVYSQPVFVQALPVPLRSHTDKLRKRSSNLEAPQEWTSGSVDHRVEEFITRTPGSLC